MPKAKIREGCDLVVAVRLSAEEMFELDAMCAEFGGCSRGAAFRLALKRLVDQVEKE